MDLQTFFSENKSVALGFSGGVDSSYLLHVALHYGANIKAYFVKTAFQPEFELRDAYRVAESLGTQITVLHRDVLANSQICQNPSDRCYHCKKFIFNTLKIRAAEDGFTTLIDGTNASDDADDRPGMRALEQLSVRSPLRECAVTKDEIRAFSKEAGLFTWNKPAYACLATRVPTGTHITSTLLKNIEKAEDSLFSMGFTDFRVRVLADCARIQIPLEQMPAVIESRKRILYELRPYFQSVLLDLYGR